MSEIKKILVVGASIAGPAVCYWLKNFGFTPTLIEKSPTLRKGGHAVDIRGSALEVVKKMGIYSKIGGMRTQIEQGYYVDVNGNTLQEEQGEKFGFRQGEEVEIVRGDLVEILMQTIKEVPCHYDQNLIRIEQHDDYVEVTFKDKTTEEFDLIIGADGLHSSVRRMAFAKEEYDFTDLGSYISIFTIPNYLKLNRSEVVFESNQKLISVCHHKNPDLALAACMFRSPHKLTNIRDEQEQKNFLKKTFLDLGWETNNILKFIESTPDFYFDAIMQVKMKSWTNKRVALVGDSGYCPSPLSGQGSSLALVGAYLLAGELKNAKGDFELAFERYNSLLHPFVLANQEIGVWASETFLLPDEISKEAVETRTDNVLEKLKSVSHAIVLPEY